jgi:hypothetical protein
MSFSWRCQYCSWSFQMNTEAVAAALTAADATQARHHVEHFPRCRKALKIPVEQLRHHAPNYSSAAIQAPTYSPSHKEDEKTMIETPAPVPSAEIPAPAAPVEPKVLPPAPVAAPKPVVKKPAVKKPAAKKPAAKKPVAKKKPAAKKKPVAKKKPAVKKKPVAKKKPAAKKTIKKAAKKGKK